ncbi:MAG: hypothetical protein P8X46_13240 [Nitrospirales bacterium]
MFVAAIKEELYTLLIVGLINIVISMYYYLIVVKKMYINEPADPSPIAASLPIKVAVYVGIAGTVLLGVYPGPFIDWAVSATLMFSNIGEPIAAILSKFALENLYYSTLLLIVYTARSLLPCFHGGILFRGKSPRRIIFGRENENGAGLHPPINEGF